MSERDEVAVALRGVTYEVRRSMDTYCDGMAALRESHGPIIAARDQAFDRMCELQTEVAFVGSSEAEPDPLLVALRYELRWVSACWRANCDVLAPHLKAIQDRARACLEAER